MHWSIHNHAFSGYLSTALIITFGICGAVFCMILWLLTTAIQVFSVPIVFLFGTGVLAYGWIKRVLVQRLISKFTTK